MDKILDMLTEIEAEVEWSIHDGDGSEKIMALIHRAMDIAVNGKAHKWPEEKPDRLGRYLCCMEDTAGYKHFDTARWGYVNGDGMSEQTWVGDHWSDGDIYEYEIHDVKYWWHLPEVTE